jgi:hypothetical protein
MLTLRWWLNLQSAVVHDCSGATRLHVLPPSCRCHWLRSGKQARLRISPTAQTDSLSRAKFRMKWRRCIRHQQQTDRRRVPCERESTKAFHCGDCTRCSRSRTHKTQHNTTRTCVTTLDSGYPQPLHGYDTSTRPHRLSVGNTRASSWRRKSMQGCVTLLVGQSDFRKALRQLE